MSDTFAVIGRSFVVLANVAVMLLAIPAVVRIAGEALTPVSPAFSLISAIGLLATGVGTLLAYGVIFQITIRDLHGQSAPTDGMFKVALRKFWPLLGFVMLLVLGMCLVVALMVVPRFIFGANSAAMAVVILGLMVLLIVPIIMLGLAWSAAMPAIVLEDCGVFASFGRSAALTRGKRWSLFLLYFLVGLVTLIIELVLFAVFGGFHGLVSREPSLTNTVLSSLLNVILVPFGAVLNTALFDQLRGREGYGAEAVAEVFA
ncbi:MAG: hypothetical protein ACXWKT_19050 [Caulobacteraceae bacterium]